MFYGSSVHALDDKNRFILPAKLRDAVSLESEGHKFTMTRGLDETIFVFPPSIFRTFTRKMQGSAWTMHRQFKLQFAANASDVAIDTQGRITIPAALRMVAGIQKDIVVIGNFDWIEIWAKEKWDQFEDRSKEEGTYDQHARELFEGLSNGEETA